MEPIQINKNIPIPARGSGPKGRDNSILEEAIPKMEIGHSFEVPKEYISYCKGSSSTRKGYFYMNLIIRKIFKNNGFVYASRQNKEEKTMRVWRVE